MWLSERTYGKLHQLLDTLLTVELDGNTGVRGAHGIGQNETQRLVFRVVKLFVFAEKTPDHPQISVRHRTGLDTNLRDLCLFGSGHVIENLLLAIPLDWFRV
jgi:hypothetical protein